MAAAAPAAARGRRGRRLIRPSARPPTVPQRRAADAHSAIRPSAAPAQPHAKAAGARIAATQPAPGLRQCGRHERRDLGQARPRSASVMSPGGSPRRYLLFRRPPPTPSPPSPAALCGEKELAPSPPPFSSPRGRASVNRQPRQRGCGRRAGPALPHAGS